MDAQAHAAFARLEKKLDRVILQLAQLTIGEIIMSQEMDQLNAAVENETTIDQSVLIFMQGLAQQITDAAGDRAKALALAATVKSNSDKLAAALVANTPSAPPATP